MLISATRKRIKEHKWNNHSNKSQFFKRLKDQSHAALADMTLLAQELDDEQLKEIFTIPKLEPLMRALMRPELTRKTNDRRKKYKRNNDRIFFLSFMYFIWSLETLGTVIDNKWAKKMYSEHNVKLREIVHALWHERIKKIKGEV